MCVIYHKENGRWKYLATAVDTVHAKRIGRESGLKKILVFRIADEKPGKPKVYRFKLKTN